ncbi:MAG: Ig-like domain-containing domain [Chitinophagales bacterium]
MYQRKNIQNKRFHYFIISLFHCFIIFSCAQITAPTGGKKDTSPPVISVSSPPNYSTNFQKKEIKVEFDEWIQSLTNPKTQVIISPEIEPFPEITIARNELSIKLKNQLQPNTTYSMFFGDNIKDNNEGNAFSNYKYIFSTGNFIDSLNIKGSVKTTLDKIPDNTFLLLYKEKEDSAFLKKRPFYITKVQPDGSFNLENIKEGDYRIYALSDKNGNYYYDLPTEAIGFTDSVSPVNSNLDTLSLELFMPEDAKLRIQDFDRVIKGGILHLTFNRELSLNQDDITVSIQENAEISPIAFQEKEPKKISVYFPKIASDTNSFTLILKNKNELIDSLKVRTESKKFKTPVLFFNDTVAYKSLTVIESEPLKLISSSYSLSEIDTAKMYITDTSENKIAFYVSRDEDLQTYFIKSSWQPGMKYGLHLKDSVFSDLVGNYSKMQEISFSAISVKKAGNLLITYQLPQKNTNYIAILKDNSGKVLNKQILRDSQAVKINYGLQVAGVYSVEVIEDANNNGIWNSGSFTTKTLPEKIYKELKPIVIKENWDAEETIKVDFSAVNAAIKNNVNANTPTEIPNKVNLLKNQSDKKN